MSSATYPLSMALAMLLTLMIAVGFARRAFSVTNPSIPEALERLFPLRGKWLYRGVAMVALTMLLPLIYMASTFVSVMVVCLLAFPFRLFF